MVRIQPWLVLIYPHYTNLSHWIPIYIFCPRCPLYGQIFWFLILLRTNNNTYFDLLDFFFNQYQEDKKGCWSESRVLVDQVENLFGSAAVWKYMASFLPEDKISFKSSPTPDIFTDMYILSFGNIVVFHCLFPGCFLDFSVEQSTLVFFSGLIFQY